MKVCVTAQADNLDADVDPRFGRCEYFIFVETDTLAFEAVRNPHTDSMGGAGVQSGQLVADRGAGVVLTGNIGPNAFATLQAAGINIGIGVTGKVSAAVDKYIKGEVSLTDGPSVDSKFGSR